MTDNKYRYLNCLSIEKLEVMLQLAVNAHSDEEDGEYVNAILEVMEKKESEHPTGRLSDVDQAWGDFQKYYNTEEGTGQSLYFSEEEYQSQSPMAQDTESVSLKRQKRSYHTTFAAAIAAVLIVAAMVPMAFGYPNLFQMIGRWTAEQFYLQADSSGIQSGLTAEEVPNEYVGLMDVLQERGIDRLYIPRKIPEGFIAGEPGLYVQPNGDMVHFYVVYENGKDSINIGINICNEDSLSIYEKDNRDVEIYQKNGREHYIFCNYDMKVAVWYEDGLEYSVGTTLPMSNLKDMIDVIYEE